MRLYRNAIILIVVLGLLIGAYFVTQKFKKEDDTSANENEVIKIIDVTKDDIQEISIINNEGEFVFNQVEVDKVVEVDKDGEKVEETQKEKVWQVIKPDDLKVDASAIDSIAWNVSSLTAEKLIEEEPSDLNQYGLDKPSKVSIKMADSSTHTLELGNQTPTKGGYYVKTADSNKVYTIGSYTGEKLDVKKNNIRDKTLYTLTSDDINVLSMDRAGSNVFTAKKESDGNWSLSYPIKYNADLSDIAPMLDAVSAFSVMNFVKDNPTDLEQYGLKNPKYALGFATNDQVYKIFLGNEKVKDKEIYAMMDGGNEVFTLEESSLTFIDKPLEEIIEVFAYIVNINDVSRVVVNMDGEVDTSAIKTDEENKDNDEFTFNDKKADDSLFRKYYQGLIGVTINKVVPDANPVGTPEITFTYTLKKAPGTMKVEFIPKDEYDYYVVKNGEYAGITVSKKSFDKEEGVRVTRKNLIDDLNK